MSRYVTKDEWGNIIFPKPGERDCMYGPSRVERAGDLWIMHRSPALKRVDFDLAGHTVSWPVTYDVRFGNGASLHPVVDSTWGVCAYVYNYSTAGGVNNTNVLSQLPKVSATLTSHGFNTPNTKDCVCWWQGSNSSRQAYLCAMPRNLGTDKRQGPLYSSRDSYLHVRNTGAIDSNHINSNIFSDSNYFSYYKFDKRFYSVSGPDEVLVRPSAWCVVACKNCRPYAFGNFYKASTAYEIEEAGRSPLLTYNIDNDKGAMAGRWSSTTITREDIETIGYSRGIQNYSDNYASYIQKIGSFDWLVGNIDIYFCWCPPGDRTSPSSLDFNGVSTPPIVRLVHDFPQDETIECIFLQYSTEINF